jgi:hypothetical protein
MKRPCAFACVLFLVVTGAHAIGLQHGVFRSQSTQGSPWQGTATIESEKFDITVCPDYLDVTLEWVFKVGGSKPAAYANALEIVGNLNLDAHSSVVGLLTWYKGKILKGKLKSDSAARQQYEQVVDRASAAPPPPRDPVLFEYGWGEDNYYISIFPAVFDSTRTVRIRYLIPAFTINGVNKIVYPYSFTKNPVVSIKRGPGVSGYIVEASRSKTQFVNTTGMQLDAKAYSFEAYGGNGGQSISSIIPVLAKAAEGSTLYRGAFAVPSFGGEMCHVAVMSGERALQLSQVKEDYVVLWRWNHPKILAKYARQIVEQSTVLKRFFTTLTAANKRAALIVSKEGAEQVVFHLDKQGGPEFNRLLAYLDSLRGQKVIDPPLGPYKSLSLAGDAAKALREFDAAIEAAMKLFEKDVASQRHLLILTAGPQLVTIAPASSAVPWDSTIDVGMLNSRLTDREIDGAVTMPLDRQYWPGIDISTFVAKHCARLTVKATVGNGVDSSTIAVLSQAVGSASYSGETTTEMHLYSDRPLTGKIGWTVLQGTKKLAQFVETPRMVTIADGMQYARLLGASPYLTPLASVMPSSIAAKVGFVDKNYSLVALEEDSLPSRVARRYETAGVPELQPNEIFPAPGEKMIPVADWLKANPPQSMSHYSGMGWGGGGFNIVVFDRAGIALNVKALPAAVEANAAVRIMPADAPVYGTSSAEYPDYSEALAVRQEPVKAAAVSEASVTVRNGLLTVNLDGLEIENGASLHIAIFDCLGRMISRWNIAAPKSAVAPLRVNLARGAYVVKISAGSFNIVKRIAIR